MRIPITASFDAEGNLISVEYAELNPEEVVGVIAKDVNLVADKLN